MLKDLFYTETNVVRTKCEYNFFNQHINIVRTTVIVTNVVVTKVAAPSEVTLMRRLKLGKIPMLGKKIKKN